MCGTKFWVYIVCVLSLTFISCSKHCVNNPFVGAVQKSFNEATRSSIRENCGYILKFAPNQMETGRRYLSAIENVIKTL